MTSAPSRHSQGREKISTSSFSFCAITSCPLMHCLLTHFTASFTASRLCGQRDLCLNAILLWLVAAPLPACPSHVGGRGVGKPVHSFSLLQFHSHEDACVLSRVCVQPFVTPWIISCQAPLSMGFSRQEYWSGLPCPPPGDLPDPGIKPVPLASPALAGGFFTTSATWEAPVIIYRISIFILHGFFGVKN